MGGRQHRWSLQRQDLHPGRKCRGAWAPVATTPTRTSSSGSFGAKFSLSSVLRIGVGDGQNDPEDWALLMPLSGNGEGDYNGANVWAFGGEDETNNGHSGTVTVSATCAATTTTS